MDRIRSRLGKSVLAVVVITCAVIFLVFGLLGSLGLFFSNGARWFEGVDWSNFNFRFGVGRTVAVDDSVHQDLAGIERIVIKSVATDPEISTAGTQLEATLKGTCRTFSDPVDLVAETSGSTLTVRLKYPTGGITGETLEYRILIPETYAGDLSVETVSADVALEDPPIRFTVKDLSASTVSGAIRVSGIPAVSYAFSTISGRIALDGATGAVDATTVSGDIDATLAESVAVRAETVSGGTTLILPSDAAFSVDFETVSGSFSSDFSLSLVKQTRTETKGAVGSGGPELKVESVSGRLALQKG